ncbi:MAG: hypothetical protein V2B15_03515 [Bacteroidota bacterium]
MKKGWILGLIVLMTGVHMNAQTKTAVTAKEAELLLEINLSEQDLVLFKEQTRQKVEELQQHIATIGDKAQPSDKRNLAEREALKLFYSGAQIEISSRDASGEVSKVTRDIAQYLARLKSLPYTRVVIRFYEIAYISEFTRGPDGRYYSVATILQEFTGFTGDNITYSDLTKKEVEIIVDLVEDPFFKEKSWRIFLGDIKATETREAPPS